MVNVLNNATDSALGSSTSSDADNDRDTSSNDSFFAVCSHNPSDEDLAMSIKYRRVPFRPAFRTGSQPEENAKGGKKF